VFVFLVGSPKSCRSAEVEWRIIIETCGCDTSILQKREFGKFIEEKFVTAFPGIEVLSLEEPQNKVLFTPLFERLDAQILGNKKFFEKEIIFRIPAFIRSNSIHRYSKERKTDS